MKKKNQKWFNCYSFEVSFCQYQLGFLVSGAGSGETLQHSGSCNSSLYIEIL